MKAVLLNLVLIKNLRKYEFWTFDNFIWNATVVCNVIIALVCRYFPFIVTNTIVLEKVKLNILFVWYVSEQLNTLLLINFNEILNIKK